MPSTATLTRTEARRGGPCRGGHGQRRCDGDEEEIYQKGIRRTDAGKEKKGRRGVEVSAGASWVPPPLVAQGGGVAASVERGEKMIRLESFSFVGSFNSGQIGGVGLRIV